MKKLLLVVLLGALPACSGLRQTENTFSTHAECLRVLGYPVPGDDLERARTLVPKGGIITSVSATPADWSSVLGVLGNIFWIHQTKISGTK